VACGVLGEKAPCASPTSREKSTEWDLRDQWEGQSYKSHLSYKSHSLTAPQTSDTERALSAKRVAISRAEALG
jgi:hypothetical protein